MKKYLNISIITNIILCFLATIGINSYLDLSVEKNYGGTTDVLVILGVVLVDILFNNALFKFLKIDGKKIYCLIPVIVFITGTNIGILLTNAGIY